MTMFTFLWEYGLTAETPQEEFVGFYNSTIAASNNTIKIHRLVRRHIFPQPLNVHGQLWNFGILENNVYRRQHFALGIPAMLNYTMALWIVHKIYLIVGWMIRFFYSAVTKSGYFVRHSTAFKISLHWDIPWSYNLVDGFLNIAVCSTWIVVRKLLRTRHQNICSLR